MKKPPRECAAAWSALSMKVRRRTDELTRAFRTASAAARGVVEWNKRRRER
jgi:hypothetical protein